MTLGELLTGLGLWDDLPNAVKAAIDPGVPVVISDKKGIHDFKVADCCVDLGDGPSIVLEVVN